MQQQYNLQQARRQAGMSARSCDPRCHTAPGPENSTMLLLSRHRHHHDCWVPRVWNTGWAAIHRICQCRRLCSCGCWCAAAAGDCCQRSCASERCGHIHIFSAPIANGYAWPCAAWLLPCDCAWQLPCWAGLGWAGAFSCSSLACRHNCHILGSCCLGATAVHSTHWTCRCRSTKLPCRCCPLQFSNVTPSPSGHPTPSHPPGHTNIYNGIL